VLLEMSWALLLLRATRLLTRQGEPIRLGTEDSPEIARKIAERAGANILDYWYATALHRTRDTFGLFARKTPPKRSPARTEAHF